MQTFFYADAHSVELLASARPKALLTGSDFGYGNFGDVLQLASTVMMLRRMSDLAVIPVFALESISRSAGAAWLREAYAVDGLIFVVAEPIEPLQAERLGLQRVASICNVPYLQLYGGGFLNEQWGDFVLGVTQTLLDGLPGLTYVVSGQQISEGYASRVAAHVGQYRPRLFGVRDHRSKAALEVQGTPCIFSFDDAVEPLVDLRDRLGVARGEGAFLHLNLSGYTGNDAAIGNVAGHLDMVAQAVSRGGDVILVQAYRDAREVVLDTVESVKRLESAFPFTELRFIPMLNLILPRRELARERPLRGRFGYSCSYHVTLWLQLSGIPCWLRGENSYYQQKRVSLGIEESFETFLERQAVPDHSANLQARGHWLDAVGQILGTLGPVRNRMETAPVLAQTRTVPFHFKGEPNLESRLVETWSAVVGLQAEVARLQGEVVGLQGEIGSRNALLEETQARLKASESHVQDMSSRMHALQEQLTAAGSECRQLREGLHAAGQSNAQLHVQLQESLRREHEAQALLTSRSWQWTRPLRALHRYRQTGRFDVAGKVGLGAALRKVFQKLLSIVGRRTRLDRLWASWKGR